MFKKLSQFYYCNMFGFSPISISFFCTVSIRNEWILPCRFNGILIRTRWSVLFKSRSYPDYVRNKLVLHPNNSYIYLSYTFHASFLCLNIQHYLPEIFFWSRAGEHMPTGKTIFKHQGSFIVFCMPSTVKFIHGGGSLQKHFWVLYIVTQTITASRTM